MLTLMDLMLTDTCDLDIFQKDFISFSGRHFWHRNKNKAYILSVFNYFKDQEL